MRIFSLFIVGFCLNVGAETLAADPEPIPMLNTGGHMGLITDIAFTPDGKRLISASDDKTIRIWDLEIGKTVEVIRGQISRGPSGKIRAMALSSDGNWLAAGGVLPNGAPNGGHHIRLYDFRTGQLAKLLQGHKGAVGSLAFSPDNKLLISGDVDGTAIIWNVIEVSQVSQLRDHKGPVYGVGFSADSARAVTVSDNTATTLWKVDNGYPIKTMMGHKARVLSLAMSPDGVVATGDELGEIRLWNDKTGKFLKILGKQSTEVGSLTFSPDGAHLLSTCDAGDCANKPEIVWSIKAGRQVLAYRGHDHAVLASAISPDGRWAATGGGRQRAIHIWELKTGKPRRQINPLTLKPSGNLLNLFDVGKRFSAVGVSKDLKHLGFGDKDPCPELGNCPNQLSDLHYSLRLATKERGLGSPREIAAAETGAYQRVNPKYQTWSLAHRFNPQTKYFQFLDVKQGGETVATITRQGNADGKQHLAYTFSPKGNFIITGGNNGWLSQYDRDGNKVGEYSGHTNIISDIATSADGRILVSGSGDKTLKIWNLETRELIASLFFASGDQWVMWAPQGYYASSPKGDALVGWHINRGLDKRADYYTARQLREYFYRPDIIEQAIILASAEKAIEESANTGGLRLEELPEITQAADIKIIEPKNLERIQGKTTDIVVKVRAGGSTIKNFEVIVNETRVTPGLPSKTKGMKPELASDDTQTFHNIKLARGENRITVRAQNEIGLFSEDEIIVSNDGPGALDKREILYVISIGVNEYPNVPAICRGPSGSCDLNFAVKDATVIRDLVVATTGRMHTEVIERLLVNGAGGELEPTRKNIVRALDILRSSNDNDTVIIFLSGHGVNIHPNGNKTNYYFLPTNARPSVNGLWWDSDSVYKWGELVDQLSHRNGRYILFVDTCYAQAFHSPEVAKVANDKNITVFSAVDADSEAEEREENGHGVFTYAVIEGLKGEADIFPRKTGDKKITLKELDTYVTGVVKDITDGKMSPHADIGKDYIIVER